jgi:hypothetical protein
VHVVAFVRRVLFDSRLSRGRSLRSPARRGLLAFRRSLPRRGLLRRGVSRVLIMLCTHTRTRGDEQDGDGKRAQ